jgi:hypothetical protein
MILCIVSPAIYIPLMADFSCCGMLSLIVFFTGSTLATVVLEVTPSRCLIPGSGKSDFIVPVIGTFSVKEKVI